MNYVGKTVGIWGFGIVGQSAAQFLKALGARILLYDANAQRIEQSGELTAPSMQAFFDASDYILPSPGVDTRAYRSAFTGIWLNELDLFAAYFEKPVIAITGSLGKTTVTHLLSCLLKEHGVSIATGGNIGTPMLSLIQGQQDIDLAVLELSSFQLEHSRQFAPDMGIWTNFHENHLDRHTMKEYFDAKYNIIAHQSPNQKALVPWDLKERIAQYNPKSTLSYFTQECPSIPLNESLYCYSKEKKELHNHQTNQAIPIKNLPSNSYLINWLTIWAACDVMGINVTKLPIAQGLEHRLETVAKINDAIYINDSKSTTPASTIAALNQLPIEHTLLILGGLNKGIDRTDLVRHIKKSNHVTVYCFGSQAHEIGALCSQYGVPHKMFETLESVMQEVQLQSSYRYILFSPAGSSFDLFANYIERGKKFKELVLNQIAQR